MGIPRKRSESKTSSEVFSEAGDSQAGTKTRNGSKSGGRKAQKKPAQPSSNIAALPEVQKPSISSTKPSKRKTVKKKRTFDVDKLAEEVFENVDAIFGFTSVLRLSRESSLELVRDIVELVSSTYSSKPDPESLIKRIKRNQKALSEYIVAKLVEIIEKPTPEQLEYIVTRGGKAVIPETEKLYKLAMLYKMDNLVDILRHVWNTHRGKGLITCPKCGFNAITPERYCMICGHTVLEDYVRSVLKFDDKFEIYLKSASVAELNDILQLGYVLVGDKGVYSPRSPRARLENTAVYVVQLRRHETSRIVEEINSRELKI